MCVLTNDYLKVVKYRNRLILFTFLLIVLDGLLIYEFIKGLSFVIQGITILFILPTMYGVGVSRAKRFEYDLRISGKEKYYDIAIKTNY
ncbi:hypothetical protein [Bacillus cereus]|uniref:hypothetical protein n=1 Tax=Bacillus cereus TaxID=1396 RepID=UPI000BF6B811|nr:hypothetical protein [Bacillus cereus]PEQ94315.1 hypothetical protein CN477_30630 [Bacillus cereus]